MHYRWTVVRGWSLYWYRMKGDEINRQKGILMLPSQDVDAQPPQKRGNNSDKVVGFHLPKGKGKDGEIKIEGSRGMSFGDDTPTRIFRNILSYLIRYKIYAEKSQKEGQRMDPQIERYFKLDDKIIRS